MAGMVVCLVASGCTPSSGGLHPAGPAVVQQQEAQYLLGLVHLPAGARQPSAAPESPPSRLIALDSSAIDTARFWVVSMPYNQVLNWLQAHPPSGLSLSISEPGSGFAYSAPPSAAWGSADLAIVVAPEGADLSMIRADAVIDWLASSPLPDSASGLRMRLTVAGGCPASDAHMVGVTNAGADLEGQMLPSGKPTGALLCTYNGMNGTAYTLETQQALDAAAARNLADSVAQIPVGRAIGVVGCSCPAGFGSAIVVALSYAGRSDVDLWVADSGCSSIANGDIVVASCGSPDVATIVSKIAALVGE